MRLVTCLLLGLFVSLQTTSAGADANPPAPASVEPAPKADVAELIKRLGDIDPTIREAASQQLAEIGKSALPELQEAKDADDPEIRARVRTLIRKAERRLPPAAPPRQGLGHRTSVRVSQVNGERTVDVDDNGYRIKIRQGPNGIVMDVTGVEHGSEVTETYKAKDSDALKRENPEAFNLYDKYNQDKSVFDLHIGRPGNVGRVQMPVRPGNAQQWVVDAQVEGLERMIDQLQRHAQNLPPEHRDQLWQHVDRLRQRQDDVHLRLQDQIREERKKALNDLSVPLRDEPAKEEPGEKKDDEPEKVKPGT